MQQNNDIVYGIHATLELIKTQPHLIKTLFIVANRDDARLTDLQKLAAQFNISVQMTRREKLDKLAHSHHHQGVVAICQ